MPRVATTATISPSRAPQNVNTMLSVSNWRMRRYRPAPSASRMAISCLRVAVRASNKFERFAQTINMTTPTAEARMKSAGRIFPLTCSPRELRWG